MLSCSVDQHPEIPAKNLPVSQLPVYYIQIHQLSLAFFSLCRWIEKVNLKVRATCANPPEIKGRKIKDVHVFRACPGGESLPTAPAATPPKLAKAPKANKPKPMHLSAHHMKMLKAKSKPRRSSPADRKSKRRVVA